MAESQSKSSIWWLQTESDGGESEATPLLRRDTIDPQEILRRLTAVEEKVLALERGVLDDLYIAQLTARSNADEIGCQAGTGLPVHSCKRTESAQEGALTRMSSRDFTTPQLFQEQLEQPAQPDGIPFSHVSLKFFQDSGVGVVKLPMNSIGLAVWQCFSVSLKEEFVCLEIVKNILTTVLCLCATFAIQFVILFVGIPTLLEGHEDSCRGNPALRITCTLFLGVQVLIDVRETLTVHAWLDRIPHALTDSRLLRQKFTKWERDFLEEEEILLMTAIKAVSGMTHAKRSLIYLFILLPKSLVQLGLTWTATAYVLYAPTAEAILMNSVALMFVLDIEAYIFEVFVDADLLHCFNEDPGLSLFVFEALEKYSFMSCNIWMAPLLASTLLVYIAIVWTYYC